MNTNTATTSSASAVGLAVPDFTIDTTGGEFTLAAQRGHPVVLYFYPRDNTPGCTTQAQQYRDLHDKFAAAGCVVLGVSRDSLKSHQGFKAKYGLPFELAADTEGMLCRMFDVIKNKLMYGKQVQGIERSAFLIDANGVLRREWRGIKADGNAAAVLDELMTA